MILELPSKERNRIISKETKLLNTIEEAAIVLASDEEYPIIWYPVGRNGKAQSESPSNK